MRSGRSVEAEQRAVREQVLAPPQERFAEQAARLRRTGPVLTTDSAEMIRADRDRDQATPL